MKTLPVLYLSYILTNKIFDIGPVFMIQFKFRRLEIPMHFSVEHLGMIAFEEFMRQLFRFLFHSPVRLLEH